MVVMSYCNPKFGIPADNKCQTYAAGSTIVLGLVFLNILFRV